jgi:hypothetical protein
MCEVRSREKRAGTKKKKYNGQQQKEMDCHEPHPAPNEKTQPIQWTERPTGALVAVNSLWPEFRFHKKKKTWNLVLGSFFQMNYAFGFENKILVMD